MLSTRSRIKFENVTTWMSLKARYGNVSKLSCYQGTTHNAIKNVCCWLKRNWAGDYKSTAQESLSVQREEIKTIQKSRCFLTRNNEFMESKF